MNNSLKFFWQMSSVGRAVGCLVAVIVVFWQDAVLAQPVMLAASGASTTFTISGFEITGDTPLSSEDTSRLLARFVGPGANLETLQRATAALEAEFSKKGFTLHRVSLPPQEVGAKVVLNVVKFVVGNVSVQGLLGYSEANIRASLPELQEGAAPNFGALAVQTTIANENAGKQVQISLKASTDAEKIDATIQVKESKPLTVSASLSNTGSDATGRDRLTLVGGHSNVLGLDHQFSGAYTTSMERTEDVKQLGLNYRIPLYRAGGVLSLSYTVSDVVGNFGTFNSTGAGQTLGASYSHYLLPVGGRRSFVTLGLEQKLFEASKINGVTGTQVDRTSRPLTLGYTARIESDASIWGYNAELAVNLPGNSGNDLAAYRSEDPRISNIHWTVLRGGVNYSSYMASGWLWSARGQFQYSAEALIAGEQFGLGGASSVRGAGERTISGDSGLLTSLEVTGPELRPGLRLLGFVDAGWLRNGSSELNPNKPGADQLASAGLGLRFATSTYGFSLDWGRVISGSVLSSIIGSGTPQSGDQKIHLNFSTRF